MGQRRIQEEGAKLEIPPPNFRKKRGKNVKKRVREEKVGEKSVKILTIYNVFNFQCGRILWIFIHYRFFILDSFTMDSAQKLSMYL